MKNEKPDLKYIAKRLKNFIFPPIRVLPFPPQIVIDKNVAIAVRDGTILRANIFRPEKEGQFPVIMCAHPLEFSLMPSATFFKKGDRLRLDLQGHWFTGKNPIIYGPARYEASPEGIGTIYSGVEFTSRLLLPVSPVQDCLD
jgi:predicted acyl esterase